MSSDAVATDYSARRLIALRFLLRASPGWPSWPPARRMRRALRGRPEGRSSTLRVVVEGALIKSPEGESG